MYYLFIYWLYAGLYTSALQPQTLWFMNCVNFGPSLMADTALAHSEKCGCCMTRQAGLPGRAGQPAASGETKQEEEEDHIGELNRSQSDSTEPTEKAILSLAFLSQDLRNILQSLRTSVFLLSCRDCLSSLFHSPLVSTYSPIGLCVSYTWVA